jgi:glycosyltransferase involved in cell wall biosynthesis
LRILFCNYEYPPLGGGGGVVMAAMARSLAERHDVTVLTSQAVDLPYEGMDANVKVVRVPVFFRKALATANFPSMAAYLPMGLWRGLQLGRRQRFDIINTHFAVPTGPLGDWLSKRMGIPNILSVHGGDLYDPSKKSSPHRHAFLRRAVARLLVKADGVVAQSRDTARNVEKIYGVGRKVDLVPLGIDRPPQNIRAQRSEFDLPENAFVMVTAGRIVPRKASTQLIDTLVAVPDAFLLVVGDGPEAAAVKHKAMELGVYNRLRMLGYVPDEVKYKAYAAADVFVSTAQHEGFGLVFLEAMSFGLPVVCYNRGGQTDFLSTPETGFVIQLNDQKAFNEAVKALRDSAQTCQAVGRHNLGKVEDFFIEHCAARYERIFSDALAARQERQ